MTLHLLSALRFFAFARLASLCSAHRPHVSWNTVAWRLCLALVIVRLGKYLCGRGIGARNSALSRQDDALRVTHGIDNRDGYGGFEHAGDLCRLLEHSVSANRRASTFGFSDRDSRGRGDDQTDSAG